MIIREKGTIVKLMDEQSGTSKAGNAWTSREFVIEVDNEAVKNFVRFKAFGRELSDLQSMKEGDLVEVSYKPQSREFNGRWYDEHRLFGVKPLRDMKPQEVEEEEEEGKDDLPF